MTVNDVMTVTLRYFTEFGKPMFQHICVDLWRNLYFVMRVRCRRKESSRSLSHLLMSFLSCISHRKIKELEENFEYQFYL